MGSWYGGVFSVHCIELLLLTIFAHIKILSISRRFFWRRVGFEALTLLLAEESFLADFIMEVCCSLANVLMAYFVLFTGRFHDIGSATSREESYFITF